MQGQLVNYLGLAQKSNSVIFGFDNIKSYRKKIYVVILCCSANDKTKQHIIKLCEERDIKLRILNKTIDELIGSNNCKVLGIVNEHFVKPILESKE